MLLLLLAKANTTNLPIPIPAPVKIPLTNLSALLKIMKGSNNIEILEIRIIVFIGLNNSITVDKLIPPGPQGG